MTTREIVVEPLHGWRPLDLRELWEARELLVFLVWRNLKARYQQTFLGAAWAVLQPVLTMAIFSVFLGRLARVPSDGLPYPLFAFCGLVPWTYFANSLTLAANSLVEHERMLSKVYFPRLVLPLSWVATGLVDLLLAMCVLLALMAFYGVTPTAGFWALPLFLALAAGTALGAGLWLATLNVRYRDVKYAIPFLVQVWLFSTPVVYPSSLLPEPWRTLYGLNPMAGVVEGFRWALLGTGAPSPLMFAASAVGVAILLLGGLLAFRRFEATVADVV